MKKSERMTCRRCGKYTLPREREYIIIGSEDFDDLDADEATVVYHRVCWDDECREELADMVPMPERLWAGLLLSLRGD